MQIFRMPISTFNACLTLTNNAMIQYKFVLTAYHYFELESNSLMNWVASCPTNPIIGGREREVRLHYGPLHTVHHCALLGCTTVHYWPSRSGQPWIWCNLAISNSPISACYDISSYYHTLFSIPYQPGGMASHYHILSPLPSHPITFLTLMFAKDHVPWNCPAC